MERFIREYVKDTAEEMGIKLSLKQIHTIVNSIERDEVVWGILDEHIKNEIKNVL